MARLKNHTLGYSGSQINTTLDSSTETFPLNQSLYFDFSHDTNIASILTAFGLRQFADKLPADEYPGEHEFTVSHLTPFGARLDIEIIKAPKPVSLSETDTSKARRPSTSTSSSTSALCLWARASRSAMSNARTAGASSTRSSRYNRKCPSWPSLTIPASAGTRSSPTGPSRMASPTRKMHTCSR